MPPRRRPKPVSEPFLAGNPFHHRAVKLNDQILDMVKRAEAAKRDKERGVESIYRGRIPGLQRQVAQLLTDADLSVQRTHAKTVSKKRRTERKMPVSAIKKIPDEAQKKLLKLTEQLKQKITEAFEVEQLWKSESRDAQRRILERTHLYAAATAGTVLQEINLTRTRNGLEPLKLSHFGVISQVVRKPQESKKPKIEKREKK